MMPTPLHAPLQILTPDYSKLALLCSDRSICLHAKFGAYHSIRIPKYTPNPLPHFRPRCCRTCSSRSCLLWWQDGA